MCETTQVETIAVSVCGCVCVFAQGTQPVHSDPTCNKSIFPALFCSSESGFWSSTAAIKQRLQPFHPPMLAARL